MVPVAMRARMVSLSTTFKRTSRIQTRVKRAKTVSLIATTKVTRITNLELEAQVVAFESKTFAISGR
jgi:hypothetical protein